jgi:RNA polymerase sigma-70 factor, ECF subfamily
MITPLHDSRPAPHTVNAVDDAHLIRRAQERDARAFEELYRLHVPRIYAVCLRLAANPRRAEEFTQTAFVQAWQKLPQFRGECAFGSWLHRLAVNGALMDFRSTRRREARVVGAEDPAALETPPRPAPAGIRLDLEQAIAALPTQARAVFVLHDVEGYTHAEIAAFMDLQTGTTKAQLHRARQLLQEALQ